MESPFFLADLLTGHEPAANRSADSLVREFLNMGSRGLGGPRSEIRFMESLECAKFPAPWAWGQNLPAREIGTKCLAPVSICQPTDLWLQSHDAHRAVVSVKGIGTA